MSQLSFFQQYSQQENHATNNTVLLLKHIYSASPQRFNRLLNSLLDDERVLSPSFRLQHTLAHSVPDAVISQPAFGIVIETKSGGGVDLKQLENHARGMVEAGMITAHTLVCLTRERLSSDQQDKVKEIGERSGIRVTAITFSDIAIAAKDVTPEHDEASQEVVDDYENFLRRSGLLAVGDEIFVVPTRVSHDENVRLGMYFESVNRPSRDRCRFLGLYSWKEVRQLGQICAVVETDGAGQADAKIGKLPENAVFNEIFKACSYYPELKTEACRYYFVDRFHPTSIRKSTRGGIWGARVLALSSLVSDANSQSTARVAELLKGSSFE